MIICSNCGARLSGQVRFCTKCGMPMFGQPMPIREQQPTVMPAADIPELPEIPEMQDIPEPPEPVKAVDLSKLPEQPEADEPTVPPELAEISEIPEPPEPPETPVQIGERAGERYDPPYHEPAFGPPPPPPFSVPAANEQEKEKVYFGMGALILCLIVIAALSITTGLFAGLYFSAISG